ncbi:TonB-dependent receptor domain-containing protein [Thauera sinica]|uniref:TonB-dependent receptor domain-containing protein n=1 Tax=Thauera sinica TaxID=2665146 RepID=A0ABW1AQD7_9RHOO
MDRFSSAALAAACACAGIGAARADGVPTLDAVVVTATRQVERASDALAAIEVIDREDIERAGHSSLVELLSARAGIQVTTNGGAGSTSKILIRGANAGHTLLLIDGMRAGSATRGDATPEVIPLEAIERIEILRGPASALYGSDAIGGVIQIFTRKGEEGIHPSLRAGFGSDDTRTLSAALSGGIDRLRYSLVAGHDRTGGIDAKPASRAGSDPDRDGFRNDYQSASLSLGFRERDEIGVALFRADAQNDYDAGRPYDSYLDKRTESVSAHMRNQLGAGWASTLRLGHSADRAFTRSSESASSRFDTAQRLLSWQHDVALGGGSLLAAYEYLEQEVDTSTAYAETKRTVNSALLGWGGQFGRHHLQLNARHDDNSQFGGRTTGTAAYGFEFLPQWRVHGSIGTAFKAPTFNDLYYPRTCTSSGCNAGNPDLEPETALNRELGIAWEAGRYSARATYFNNRIRNLIEWALLPGTRPRTRMAGNVSDARLEGVELGAAAEWRGYRLRASVDLLDARDADTGERLARRASRAAAVAVERDAGGWTLGAELVAQGARYDAVPNTSADRMGGYGLLNAYVHYAPARDWRIEARFNNLLDKDYELVRGYATPGANAFVAVRYAPR